MSADATLPDRVNSFVEWLFKDYKGTVPRGPKVINDALLGNQYFARHEVAVIDSPLLQRLKRIKQTGLVYQVFPSARHSRFEHALGVTTLAERCLRAILDRASLESSPVPEITLERHKGDLAELRLAALLHDVGHGLCSHASEQIYEAYSDLREFKNNPEYVKNAPGEILSYLMVKSRAFQDWIVPIFDTCGARIDLDLVAKMILGQHPIPQKYFLAQIVSSPYDADKLDYIARDSFYCGLALTVDLPRFYSMIATAELNGAQILVLRNYVPLEQILFSKMTLFGSVYHHAKVKCLDHMLRSVVQDIRDKGPPLTVNEIAISFVDPVEYLYVTDDEFFACKKTSSSAFTQKMLNRFSQRDLMRRCLEVSRRTVKNWDDSSRKKWINLSEDHQKLQEKELQIYEALPGSVRKAIAPGEVLLSVPPPPKIKTDHAFVQTDLGTPPLTIEEFFPVAQWTEAYSHNKWRSFVYGPVEHQRAIRDAAIEVVRSIGLDVDTGESDRACHVA